MHSSNVTNCLTYVCLSEMEAFEALASLGPNRAPGPDSIHSQVLKICGVSFFLFIIYIIYKYQHTSQWLEKSKYNTYFKKKGSKVNPENCIPISWTSQVIKVLETMVGQIWWSFWTKLKLLLITNLDFIKKKSFLPTFWQPLKIGLLQLTRARVLMLPILRQLTPCHIRDY